MSFKFTTFRLLLAFAILPFFTQAEEFFFPWNYSTTASSHVISLSTLGGTPTIDGVPIVPGDWIGVFYTDDCGMHCGGAIEWTGDPTAVTAFGDDNLTTPWVKDGFFYGDIFIWKIYSLADGQSYDAVATYAASGQDFFQPQGFSFVTDLSGASPAWDVRLVMGQVLDNVGAWMENVTVTFDNSGGSASTDAHGYYCIELPSDWAGIATPSKAGYDFVPVDRTYTDIMNSPRGEDYVGTFTGVFYTISGTILDDASDPMEGVWVMFNSDAVLTDVNGFYTNDVPEGWSGTVTPDPYAGGFDCYIFSPLSYSYTNVGEEWLNQDFTGTIQGPYTISGEVTDDGGLPLENVEVAFTDIGSVFTNVLGVYTVTVACGYSGTATPSMLGYSFDPLTRTYNIVMGDFLSDDYEGSMFGPYAISGTITDGVNPIEGVEVVFGGDRSMSAFTDALGFYTYDVPFGWSGTATPGYQCYVFDPLVRTYTDVDAPIPNEDYTGTVGGTAIISGVITDGGTPLVGIDVVFDGVGTAVTNGLGEYSQEVPCGWTGDATPTADCFTFTPALRSYSNVMGDMAGEDYNAALSGPYTISGTVTDGVDPISNVAVAFEGIGSVFTDFDGNYSQDVPCGWSGDVTPISDCYTFTPEYITFTDVIADYPGQDFTGSGLGPYTISGYVTSIATGVGMENVEVAFSGIGSVYTDASGYYSESVPCAWNGSVTPFLLSWAFNPPNRAYTYVTSDLTDQDFTGTQDTYTISGYVTDGVNGIEGAQVIFDNGGGTSITDASGFYEQEVWAGYTGTATPYWDDFWFDPPNRLYACLEGDLTNQDYVGALSTLPPGWSFTITGTSHIISIPLSCNPNIDGIPLTPGDYIGVFFDDGGTMVCGGAVKWTGVSSVALIAYGDDLTTTEKDGFTPGETFNWKVYSWTAGEDYDAIATYDPALPQHDGTFVPDGLSALLALDATGNTYTVSGTITLDGLPLEGVTVVFSNAGGFTETDASGFYSKTLLTNWDGVATPAKTGHNFTPVNRTYASLAANWTDQDYTAALNTYIISGMVTEAGTGDPIYNVTIFLDNGGGTTHTLSTGYYSIGVLYGWTGTAYPSKDNYNFDPVNRSYISVSANLPDQDYVGEEQVWPPGWEFEITSTSHIISVPLDALPNINGVPLLPGDFVGVFFYDELSVAHCGGAAVWTGTDPVAVTAYGDDNTTLDKDGFYVGEDFEWRVYSSYVGEEYDAVVTYDPALPQSDGKFYVNGLSALLSLNATSTTMFTISGTILDSETSLGVEGVDVTYSNGGGVATTDAAGLYSLDVLFGWSGTTTPYKVRYQFLPEYYDYFQVMEAHVDDYTAIWEIIPPGWEVTPTGTSHTISVPLAALPRIDGVPLEAGDFVGVFFYDPVSGTEICGGYAEWDAVNPVAVVAYGDDLTTTDKDGFDFGENFRWKVFSWTEYAEHEAIAVYDPTMPQYDGTFFFDGLSALLDLYADPLMVVASATPDIICYDGSTQLEVIATGGSGFYTYSWTPADNLDDPTIANPVASNLLATTTFNVVVNTFVNTAEDNVEVTVYDEFLASIAADQIICYNTVPEELTSTVSGGQGNYTYQWQEFVGGAFVDIVDATASTYQPGALLETIAYRLVVTEFCGVIETNSVTITVYDEFLASIAADQIICYNTVPELLTSTVTGGEGTYTYQWQEFVGGAYVDIVDAIASTYQPGALLETISYRLVVTDYCGVIETNSVTITVYDEFLASIAADQIICYNTVPELLTSTVTGGEGTYTYQWEKKEGDLWVYIADANDPTYQPPALTISMMYRLFVTDLCGEITTDSVTITVYNEFLASIAADQIICFNTIPELLTSTVTGGEGTYTYQWEKKEGDLWVYIADANNPTYQPPALTISMMYRLFVTDLCGEITTDSVAITVYNEFLASIAADQIICYNTIPEELTSTVTGGEGTYTYQWQEFVGGAYVDIVDAIASTYQPGALLETIAYRLVVTDYCGVIETNSVTITVYDEFLASIAADQTICHNTAPDLLTSTVTGGEGIYTYQWEMNEGGTWVYIADAHGPTYQPPALTINKMYRLFVTDLCGAITTDSITITVYPEFVVSIAADQVICEGTSPEELTSIVSGGEGTYTYQWQIDTTGVFEDIAGANAATYQPGNLYGVTLYQLVVTDYCGTIISNAVSITFYESLAASIAADQTICVNTAPDEFTSTVTGGQGNYEYQWQLFALDSTLVENCYDLDDFAGNYYSNSLIDAGWTTYNVVEDVLIDGWTLNIGTLTADSWPSEISLWAKSPAGTAVNLYTPPSSGTFYDLAITTTDFDGEMSAGVWEIWFQDSYGDGGATAYTNSMCIGFISVGAWVDISGANASTYQAPILTDMMMYRLEVTDFCGIIYSNEVTIDVIQLPVAYAGEDDEICADEVYILQGDAINYSMVLWTTAGDGTFDDASLLNATYFAGPDDLDAGFADLTLTAFAIDPCTEYDEDYVTIFFAPLPTVNAGDDAIVCEDDFFMTMGWTTNAYGILWTTSGDGYFDNPQSTAALYFAGTNDLATGYVTLTLTANAIPPCTQSASDEMVLSFGYLPTAYAGEDATVCGLESYPLEGEATEYSTVLWTTSGDGIFDDAGSLTALYTPGDDDIANGSATLTLTVYAKAPCTGEAVDDMVLTIIPLPEADAGPDATTCEGDGYELSGASASNYGDVSWETAGTGTFDDPHIINPIYTASSGDIANGSVVLSLFATAIPPCPGNAYDEMTLSFSLIPTADAGEDDAICEGAVYVLAGVATDYTATEWTTGGDGTFDDPALLGATYTPGPFDLLAGAVDLTLTAFAASPCPDDAVDAMTLMIAMNPSADAGLDDKICEDETYTLSGQAENYDMTIWTTSGDGTFDNNTLLDATYHPGANDIILGYADLTLTAEPISPCAFAASDVMTLTIDRLPDVPGTPDGDTLVCAGPPGGTNDYTTTGSPNALSYYWEIFPEIAGEIVGEGTTATVTWSGEYFGLVFIKVQGINDCGAGEFSDPIEVYADDCTGLPEDLNAQLNINVYPNPSDGIFNLEISGATGMIELYILDYKGQLVHQDKIENGSGDYLKKLDISTYPKGIYFLKLVGDNVMRIEKIVIR